MTRDEQDPAATPATTLTPLLQGLAEHGERLAIHADTPHGTRTLAYRELAVQTERLAAGLSAQDGFEQGNRVLLLGGASPEWIICALGLVRAGAVPVPLDVQMSDDNLAHALADSGARHAFAQRRFVERLGHAAETDLPTWLLDAAAQDNDPQDWRRLLADAAHPAEGKPAEAQQDREAVLFYTSGTTGRPKGVPLSHRNLAFQLQSIAGLGILEPDDRVLLPLPLHHVYPFVVGMLAPLALGLPLVLPRSLTGPQVRKALKESEASVIVGIPRLYEAMTDAVEQQVRARSRLAGVWLRATLAVSGWIVRLTGRQVGRRLLSPVHARLGPSLRLLASGGAALAPDLQRRLESFGWQVASGYGLTETSPLLTVKRPGLGVPGCAGQPVPGIELRIADRQSDDPDAAVERPASVGEVLARGPGVFDGYLNLPEKTDEVLDRDGWFHTGDLGRIDDDGFLHLAGRASTLIVTAGGENVQPTDVEATYERHPLVKEIGVLQHDGQLVGLVVPDPAEAADRAQDDLRQAVQAALDEAGRGLASYQRLDDFALTHSQLERTRLGKLRRHRLADRYDGAHGTDEQEESAAPEETLSAEDRNLLEDPVASAAWSLLRERFEQRRFTPDSSLRFDLGIDSLDWLDLALALREATGVELDDEAIARVETVRDLLGELLQGEPADEAAASLFEHPESVLDENDLERLRDPGAAANAVASVLYALDRWLMRGLFRLRVCGAGHLPDGGRGFVLVPNHVSYLDPLALAAAVDTTRLGNTYWGGWTGAVFNTRLKRAVARVARVLPIDPAGGPRRNLALAAAALRRDRNLVWFPEGTRSADGTLQDFRHGIGLLLAHLSVPVVPVAIHGTHEALPAGRHWPRLKRVSVFFGEPVEPGELAGAAASGNDEDRAERIVAGLHRRLGRLLDDTATDDCSGKN